MMTAITIPDMWRIVEEHGLVPVPIDIDPYTMAPSVEAVIAATTERTKVCIFAHIFGVTYDLDPYASFLKSKNIDILQDCAQAWRGLDVFRGSQHALMTLFSFGTIKL